MHCLCTIVSLMPFEKASHTLSETTCVIDPVTPVALTGTQYCKLEAHCRAIVMRSR
jgi:hypothetical protein